MKDLQPCPFCGGEVNITYHSWDNVFSIWHKHDGCKFIEPMYIDGDYAESLSDARDIWNKRSVNDNHGELIRCRDCMYWKEEKARSMQTKWLPCMEVQTDKNWFCADGQRRADNG